MTRLVALALALGACTGYQATIHITRSAGTPAIHQHISEFDQIPIGLGVCGPDVALVAEHADNGFHVLVNCEHPAGVPAEDNMPLP